VTGWLSLLLLRGAYGELQYQGRDGKKRNGERVTSDVTRRLGCTEHLDLAAASVDKPQSLILKY